MSVLLDHSLTVDQRSAGCSWSRSRGPPVADGSLSSSLSKFWLLLSPGVGGRSRCPGSEGACQFRWIAAVASPGLPWGAVVSVAIRRLLLLSPRRLVSVLESSPRSVEVVWSHWMSVRPLLKKIRCLLRLVQDEPGLVPQALGVPERLASRFCLGGCSVHHFYRVDSGTIMKVTEFFMSTALRAGLKENGGLFFSFFVPDCGK